MHKARVKALKELELKGSSRIKILSFGYTRAEINKYTDMPPEVSQDAVVSVLAEKAGEVKLAADELAYRERRAREAFREHKAAEAEMFHVIAVAVEAGDISQTEAAKAVGLTKYKVNYEMRKFKEKQHAEGK